MRRYVIPALLAAGLSVVVASVGFGQAPTATVADPCLNPSVPKVSASISISSATTTSVATAATGKTISVCDLAMTLTGTAPTVQFKYGTQASTPCDTGATNLTGALAPTAGSFISAGGFGDHFHAPASTQLCITSGGTPTVGGWVTYVQTW
jgi:hypothetical protein